MGETAALNAIYEKIDRAARISSEEALLLLRKAPWLKIAQLAHECRVRQVGERIASYTVFPVVNYTNVCTINCSFCSFKREEGHDKAYVLDRDAIFSKIDFAMEQGADQIFLQGGVHPGLKLEYYTDLLRAIKEKYGIHIRAFSPVELKFFADFSGITVPEVIRILKESGLDSVPGAGAEILNDRVREILSPEKCTTLEWAEIMKECHRQGLPGSANIVFGSVETDEEIIAHLEMVRAIQDETNGFNTFIPWTFQAQTKEFTVRQVPSHEYLKVLGVCRIFLDNIRNIEVSVMVLGKDIGKLALHMGANDISSPVIEENVLRSFGVRSEQESQQLIREAGFVPARRDFNYSGYQEIL